MRNYSIAVLVGLSLAVVAAVHANEATDARVADLARSGTIRVAVGLGSPALAVKAPVTGETRGPAIELGRALASKIGIKLEIVEYPSPGAVVSGLSRNEWDVAFLGIDPARKDQVEFSPPYMESDFTYLVPAASSKQSVSEMDQTGVRIAVPRGDASDLRLSKLLSRAELVRTDTIAETVELVRAGQADASSSARPVLMSLRGVLPGSRVLADGYASMAWAAVVPKGNMERLSYVTEFLKEAEKSRLLPDIIERAHLEGVRLVPGS